MFSEIVMAGEMSGLQVKHKIEEMGIPLADVARRLSISPQTLQKRLAVDDIKVGVLREIATALGKSVYFFFEEGSQPSFNMQNQVNERKARQNAQNLNTGVQYGNTAERQTLDYVTELELRLKAAEAQVQEKNQIINDLRELLQLYKEVARRPQ